MSYLLLGGGVEPCAVCPCVPHSYLRARTILNSTVHWPHALRAGCGPGLCFLEKIYGSSFQCLQVSREIHSVLRPFPQLCAADSSMPSRWGHLCDFRSMLSLHGTQASRLPGCCPRLLHKLQVCFPVLRSNCNAEG